MLLRIAVENHLSISERQELSFAASSLKDRCDGLIGCDAVDSGAVVPAVVIYGANASGKTNLVNAISTMKKFVLWSQMRGEPDGGVPRHEFLLDPCFSGKPSRFEIDFMLNGTRFHYGFEATDEAFEAEWLYEIPQAHRRKLFERKGQDFEFGRWLRGQNHSISKLTRTNSLFLSAAAQNGHDYLSRIYRYFQDMAFSGSISVLGIEASSRVEGDGLDDRIINFLKSINTGVIGYRKKEIEISEEWRTIHLEFKGVLEKVFGRTTDMLPDTDDKMVKFELAHQGKDERVVYLDLDLESAGTRRLLLMLDQIFKALDGGHPIFIDELDASLHTYANEAMLKLFGSAKVNPHGAQIIATTHDTNLLNLDTLRRDQIWFAEKNYEGATEIYPLTDIRTRKGDNLELGYLQGRYGAVPDEDPLENLLEPI